MGTFRTATSLFTCNKCYVSLTTPHPHFMLQSSLSPSSVKGQYLTANITVVSWLESQLGRKRDGSITIVISQRTEESVFRVLTGKEIYRLHRIHTASCAPVRERFLSRVKRLKRDSAHQLHILPMLGMGTNFLQMIGTYPYLHPSYTCPWRVP